MFFTLFFSVDYCMKKKSVSIVVLNWNNAADTIDCISSILKLNYTDYNLIVCDNASTDSSFEKISNFLEDVMTDKFELKNKKKIYFVDSKCEFSEYEPNSIFLIQTGSNLGYAGGNNVGISFSLDFLNDKYFWILNNDTIVESDSLDYIVDEFNSNPKLGICGSKLIYSSDMTTLQATGASFNRWTCQTTLLNMGVPRDKFIDKNILLSKVDFIVGASIVFSRDVFEKVGLMYDGYFLYFEEADICHRAKPYFDFSIALNSVVYHKEGASTGGITNDFCDSLSIRNRLLFTKRNNPHLLWFVWLTLFGVFFIRVKRKRFKQAANVIKVMCNKLNNYKW